MKPSWDSSKVKSVKVNVFSIFYILISFLIIHIASDFITCVRIKKDSYQSLDLELSSTISAYIFLI